MAQPILTQPSEHKQKLGFPQIMVFFTLIVAFFIFFMYQLIPWGTAQFVVPLFKPSGELLGKIGFVKFDGMVWASVSKEQEPNLKNRSVEIKKEYINKEFIFDFTYKERNEENDGYVKGGTEWYAKSPVLGENPIILEPWIGFWILALVIAFILAIFLTMILPSSLGVMAILFEKQIINTSTKIRLQTGFSDEIVQILILPDDKLADKEFLEVESMFRTVWDRTETEELGQSKHHMNFEDLFDETVDIVYFRNEILYARIKEYFSDFVVKEIEDTKESLLWKRNHLLFGKGLRLYMAHHFTERYSNNVTGMAYAGAAFLIVAVGVRGLKFIPPTKPSFILLAIFLEFSMLTLLAVTLFYTEEEERMDRMLKKMEDANRSQLETLRGQQADIHQLSNALVGQTSDLIKNRVETAISEYMTSDDNIRKVIATEIAEKILIGVRDVHEPAKRR
jgi:hypothetical protein